MTYNFNKIFQVRSEIGYYRSYDAKAFDNGNRNNVVQYGFDMTYRF